MDPREFLLLATSLINDPNPSPAVCRTVIGRSYYAALNVIRALVAELKIPLDKGKDSHREVMDLVAESKDADLKKACESLARQKMVRKKADYDMDNRDVESVRKASQALIFAQEAIQWADRTRANPALWNSAAGNMLDYARKIGKAPP
jgi:hypothetical protein